ncbi:unnamed protein product [Auanema sp. JU1783]|nr:unnamed protein product [Auanema sp. JU1783]
MGKLLDEIYEKAQSLRPTINELREELETLRPTVHELRDELGRLRTIADEREEELETLRPTVHGLRDELGRLRTIADEREEEIGGLRPTINELRVELGRLRPTVRGLPALPLLIEDLQTVLSVPLGLTIRVPHSEKQSGTYVLCKCDEKTVGGKVEYVYYAIRAQLQNVDTSYANLKHANRNRNIEIINIWTYVPNAIHLHLFVRQLLQLYCTFKKNYIHSTLRPDVLKTRITEIYKIYIVVYFRQIIEAYPSIRDEAENIIDALNRLRGRI